METRSGEDALLARVASNPRYHALVRERAMVSWLLFVAAAGAFTVFTLLIALDKAILAAPLGTMATTLGIPVGFALIGLAIGSIAVFTLISNRRWDPAMAAILAEAGQ